MPAVVHELHDTDHEARLNFANWYLRVMHDGKIDPTHVLFRGETWFQIKGNGKRISFPFVWETGLTPRKSVI